MRILLAPFDPAGVAGTTARALRRRGHDARLAVLEPHPFGFGHDELIGTARRDRARFALRAAREHDVLHFQFGTTPLEFVDALAARARPRRPLLLMHYWGDDARTRDIAERLHPARARVWDAVPNRDERTTRRRLRVAGTLCDAAVVSDWELASYVAPHFRAVYVVPTPLELPLRPGVLAPLAGDGPVVVHAPSLPVIKGTEEIRAAVEQVARGRPLRARWVTGVDHATALGEMARADVVIDQLNSETTGVVTLEAMALGRPVLGEFDRAKLAPAAQDVPAIAVTAGTLATRLEELLGDEPERVRTGAAGRAYVERVHDADRVAAALEQVYAAARGGERGSWVATPTSLVRMEPLDSAGA